MSQIHRKIFLLHLLILLSISGCSTGSQKASTLAAQSAFLQLKQQYPVAADSNSDQYLAQVSNRLENALPRSASHLTPTIFLVRAGKPLAVAGPSGEILISTGFLTAIDSEAQLIFVLAHELAHSVLKHSNRAGDVASPVAAARFRQEAELEADAEAIRIMITAGYDPGQATRALAFVYMLQGVEGDLQTHPEFRERVFAIQSAITESSWIPSGIETSRSFNQFRQRIVR